MKKLCQKCCFCFFNDILFSKASSAHKKFSGPIYFPKKVTSIGLVLIIMQPSEHVDSDECLSAGLCWRVYWFQGHKGILSTLQPRARRCVKLGDHISYERLEMFTASRDKCTSGGVYLELDMKCMRIPRWQWPQKCCLYVGRYSGWNGLGSEFKLLQNWRLINSSESHLDRMQGESQLNVSLCAMCTFQKLLAQTFWFVFLVGNTAGLVSGAHVELKIHIIVSHKHFGVLCNITQYVATRCTC